MNVPASKTKEQRGVASVSSLKRLKLKMFLATDTLYAGKFTNTSKAFSE